jgi:hypothetical protein
MSKFLKLTNFLLNTNDIYKIVIQPNKYHIYIAGKKMEGLYWMVGGVIGFGSISSHTSEIEVCEKENSTDYKIVSDWIEKQ